jgi:hypothetical protein
MDFFSPFKEIYLIKDEPPHLPFIVIRRSFVQVTVLCICVCVGIAGGNGNDMEMTKEKMIINLE